ncbi:hypothetical protein [Vibrio sp. SCSIO 43136]|uniref:hypothetical protein n=1 Tax=Vibrio sp. SCSIO 43136 TaxID=2819101 RepID=UPI00207513A2|nr:hypothetical protein [Vibrio sp. SCSIO 43136]USD64907.1 hypothetical protein J4N39_12615 [Vibrio sp. SCSIO 43136]
MSALFTHQAWQLSLDDPNQKLLVLYLANITDQHGKVSFTLSEAANACGFASEMAVANLMGTLGGLGLLEKTGTSQQARVEVHHCQLHLATPQTPETETYEQSPEPRQIPVYNPAPKVPSQSAMAPPMPNWASTELGFNGIRTLAEQKECWQEFCDAIGAQTLITYPMARQERVLRDWLSERKRQTPMHTPPPTVQSTKGAMASFRGESDGGNYLSTHDLDELNIPAWAEKAFKFSAIQTEPQLIWQKFVLWHKSKANELMTIGKLESKLRYWLTNEKMNEERQARKGSSGFNGASGQAAGNGNRQKLSPSERFRQNLIQQGKKPTF